MAGSTDGERRDGRHTDTRERIVATALALFTTRGFGGTSLKDIADELGVTKAAVYYHFPAKADLARVIFTPFIEDMDAMFAGLEGRVPTRREALAAYLDTLIPHREVFAAMARDPSAVAGLDLGDVGLSWIGRMSALLIGPDPTPEDRVRLTFGLGGLARVLFLPEVDIETIRRVGLDAAVGVLDDAR